ncbi:MAG: nucleotidyltransferase domain-containing protein [Deltaproteobacteria bacterium]|nr:nucleotidyltransferase domain-containing protein [Deltaproteobacteria bacterium]
MIELEATYLEEIKRILRVYLPQIEVWAFGSRVKGDPQQHSDLDLALITSAPLALNERSALQEAFSSSDLPILIDLVDWSAIDNEFREVIRAQHWILQHVREQ